MKSRKPCKQLPADLAILIYRAVKPYFSTIGTGIVYCGKALS